MIRTQSCYLHKNMMLISKCWIDSCVRKITIHISFDVLPPPPPLLLPHAYHFRFVEAVNDCDEALRLDAKLTKLYARKGRALLRLGHFAAAEEAFNRLMEFSARDLLSQEEAADELLLKETHAALEANKATARLGLNDLSKLRISVQNLVSMEGQAKYKDALKVCEDILKLSPYYRMAHVSKASALGETQQYVEAKAYMEDLTHSTHRSIQSLFAHSAATFPCVAPSALKWTENKAQKAVQWDIPSALQFVLCIGAELGEVYISVLKNLPENRLYSADIMSKMSTLIKGLSARLSRKDREEKWGWVQVESEKLQILISTKTIADEKFKSKNFRGAQLAYTNCLKVCFQRVAPIHRSYFEMSPTSTQESVSVYYLLNNIFCPILLWLLIYHPNTAFCTIDVFCALGFLLFA